jgi:cytochrome b6-f complex iron-sulfur subunit
VTVACISGYTQSTSDRFTVNRSAAASVAVVVNLDPVLSRRTALAAGAAGAGAVTLAACGGGKPTRPKSDSPSAQAGTALVKVDDIAVGEAVAAKLPNGSPVLVARPTQDSVACFSAICTHLGCTVAPKGKQLHCPCHGSVYDAATGKVLHGPAPRPLPAVSVHVAAGEVVTGAGT